MRVGENLKLTLVILARIALTAIRLSIRTYSAMLAAWRGKEGE